MAFYDDVKVIARSWRQHFGMQFATLSVLIATFSIVGFMVCLTLNFQRVLTVWGEQVQVSAYLEDGIDSAVLQDLKKRMESRSDVSVVQYVSKEKAADLFRDQMASYAPDLMSDAEFATPFPASLQIHLREDRRADGQVATLEALARDLEKSPGVEDVSYGQSWVRSYASFVGVVKTIGAIVGLILLLASVFIVANSIRTLISGRRDEIEIFELIGATSGHIRRPYIVEGTLLCFVAALGAIVINLALYSWQMSLMKKSLAFARMAQEFHFLSFTQIAVFMIASTLLGAIGAWLTVRSMNDGWAAARGVRT
jgi:cell division transport system permease protein